MTRPTLRTEHHVESFGNEPSGYGDKAPHRGCGPLRRFLAEASIRAAMGVVDLRRMNAEGPCTLVVEIPSPAWAADVGTLIRELAEFEVCLDGAATPPGPVRIDAGRRVLVIASLPEVGSLPASLASADLRIRLAPPTNRMIARAIREAVGRAPHAMPPDAAAGLDIAEIAAAIADGSTPADCVRRLIAAPRRNSRVRPGNAVPASSLPSSREGRARTAPWTDSSPNHGRCIAQ